jgi:hypothetical protein
MTDEEFLAAFEARTLSTWTHRDHLRMAYAYLKRHPFDEALDRIRRGIRALNAARGSTGYHETITIAWVRVLKPLADADDPLDQHPELTSAYLARFYSSDRLNSPEAKAEFVEPDLAALPVFPASAPRTAG